MEPPGDGRGGAPLSAFFLAFDWGLEVEVISNRPDCLSVAVRPAR